MPFIAILACWLLCLHSSIAAANVTVAAPSSGPARNIAREPYMTLLWGGASTPLDPIRTLGFSMTQQNLQHPRYVLHSDDVPEERLETLRDEGWNLLSVRQEDYTFASLTRREMRGNAIKFHMWTLGERFDRIVYMDADMLVLRNIDHLFDDETCAADICFCETNSDQMNGGLMVLRPNREFADTLARTATEYKSYNGGDQGTFQRLFYAKYTTGYQAVHGYSYPSVQQISMQYNANPIYYHLTNRWMFFSAPVNDAFVVHFPMIVPRFLEAKPWQWQFYPLLTTYQHVWYYDHYMKMVRRSSSHSGGTSVHTEHDMANDMALFAGISMIFVGVACVGLMLFCAPMKLRKRGAPRWWIAAVLRVCNLVVTDVAFYAAFAMTLRVLTPLKYADPVIAWCMCAAATSALFVALMVAWTEIVLNVRPARLSDGVFMTIMSYYYIPVMFMIAWFAVSVHSTLWASLGLWVIFYYVFMSVGVRAVFMRYLSRCEQRSNVPPNNKAQ